MSGLSARDAVFLSEMGIGPIWTARTAASDLPSALAPAPMEAPVTRAAATLPTVIANAGLNISPAGAAAAAAANAAAVASPTVGSNAAQADGVVVAAAVAGVAPLARAMSTEDSAWGDSDATEPTEVTDEQIAGMNWQQLRAAIDSCSRCGLCKHARARVHGSGARNARWLVAAGASTALDEAEGQALAGDPGKLLTNMLGALSLSRENDVYVTNLIKCRSVTASGAERAPSAEEAAACRPYLERELALSGAGTVLTLGQIAANGLLGKPLQTALAGSRGKVHQLANVRLIATLHPGELLRRGADKALAWADLCLARAAANEPAG